MTTIGQSRHAPQPAIPLELHSAADMLACLAQALKQLQFYGATGHGAQRAVDAARIVFEDIWAEMDRLTCTVRANAFEVNGQVVYQSDGLADSLPFMFYKDGIRELVFLPGFEGEELDAFLETLGRARSVRLDDDDLVTLLWERDLACLRYGYVDAAADAESSSDDASSTAESGSASGPMDTVAAPGSVIVRRLSARAAASELAPRGAHDDPAALAPPGAATNAVSQEAAILLVPEEMVAIQREIELELERDVAGDVLSALLDSLEDATETKQAEILHVLAELVPAFLSARRWDLVSTAITDVRAMATASRIGTVHQEAVANVLGGANLIASANALLAAMQHGDVVPRTSEVEPVLTELAPLCFEQVVRTAESIKSKDLRAMLQQVVDGVITTRIEAAYSALGSHDALVLRTVLHRLQQYPDIEHVRRIGTLLRSDDAGVREAAVRVVIVCGGRDGIPILRRALSDTSAEVRIAALWGLGIWRVDDVRSELESRLQDRTLVEAPATERMALFEAYARIAGAAGIPLLSRIVHGRAGLGRRWPADLRVCAARVLVLTESKEARPVLEKAARDDDDVLRRTAQRALQRLGGPA